MGGLVAFEIARTDYLSRRSPLSRSCRETPGFPGLYRPVFEGQAALARTLSDLPTFRDAYRKRRCIVPVDGFFEWKAIKGQKAKQPYAIAMKDGTPFGHRRHLGELEGPASGEWIRTFAIITTDANELVADIHDRMPVILGAGRLRALAGRGAGPA